MNAVSTEELIAQGQALVQSLASKVHRQKSFGVELDDLVAYGELGLAQAARDFDPSQGCRFTTFAYYRIRGAIYDGLSKMSWTSRSRYRRMRFEALSNEVLATENTASEAGSDKSESNLSWLNRMTDQLAVVYFATRGEEGGGIRDSTIEDPSVPTAAAIVAQREVTRELRAMLQSLPEKELTLINAVYFEGATLQDAGAKLGLTKSGASRMHSRILEKLAHALRRRGLDDRPRE